MGFITEETHNEVVKAYEAQITALKNEVEALKASQSVETQNKERNQEAGVDHQIEMMRIFRDANITNK